MKTSFIFLFSSFLFTGYRVNAPNLPFEANPVGFPITPGNIDEASGIADSKINHGFFWIEQDSGNPPDLFLLSDSGVVRKKVHINGIKNRDWEDITVANGPEEGQNYIYLAETGDNNAKFSKCFIYRFPEPAFSTDTVYNVDKLAFQYPDGPRDAEAILVDKDTKDIYIITKREARSRLYKLPYPQSTSSTNQAQFIGELTFTGTVSAALSPDGTEILLKTYLNVYYWKRNEGETIEQTLERTPLTLGYALEPQGEGVCFKNDNSAFMTISERPFFAASVSLNMYKRR